MPEYLILRLEGPLQAWGDVALDPRRPTLPYPSRSGLAGLLANALGWRYRDGQQTTALQDALRLAVREERPPVVIRDYQTANLDDGTKDPGWAAWGIEGRNKGGTQLLDKFYLADGCFRVALGLAPTAPVSLGEIRAALEQPARPLFLGRKGCPPATRILESQVEASNPMAAIGALPVENPPPSGKLRCWCHPAEAPGEHAVGEVWDRRDFATNRFAGSRRLAEVWLAFTPAAGDSP
ncbi:MAG: type I-E CRISPR-associated protein Cas5/CasD [Armatimonadetes bacterium]|nr:type I-E CRISPR-associated protein Cas5/CasD [Armatimonadota bacterium]